MTNFFLLYLLLLTLHCAFSLTFTTPPFPPALHAPAKKYGGPLIADFNHDHLPDILLCHHDSTYLTLYLQTTNHTFIKHPLRRRRDFHGTSAFRRRPWKTMSIVLSQGGFAGTRPNAPLLFDLSDRSVNDLSRMINDARGRGRSSIPVHLGGDTRYTDLIVMNAPPKPPLSGPQTLPYKNTGRDFEPRRPWQDRNQFGGVLDVDGDGVMEVFTMHNFTVHRVNQYESTDITRAVLPMPFRRLGVVSVAEIDINNNGRFDLYVAQTATSDHSWIKQTMKDYLLLNVGGRYVDITKNSGIPQDGDTRGVTTADFNNDGWVDLLVLRYTKPSLILINNRDNTFSTSSYTPPRPENTHGDMAQAVDYDMDGRIDMLISQGDHHNTQKGGTFVLFRNITPRSQLGNYVIVHVGNAPRRRCTSLYALVKVAEVGGRGRWYRRVSGGGWQTGGGGSDLVHVGIGRATSVNVRVRWTCGVSRGMLNVAANQRIRIGIFW